MLMQMNKGVDPVCSWRRYFVGSVNFNELQFLTTLKEMPWNTVFVFTKVSDMLDSWELLFNQALDIHCP